MKKYLNKAFAILVVSTVFTHIMLLLNKHPDMKYDNRFYEYVRAGTYHFFDGIPYETLNIIYCLYFAFVLLIILRVVNIKEGFGFK